MKTNFVSAKFMPLSFKSRVVYENSNKNLSYSAKEYIDRFEEGYCTDVIFLGEGVTSRASYSSSQDFVIKQNKYNPYVKKKNRDEMGSLAQENKMLLAIDEHVKNTQKGIGYVETAKGGEFLLSSYVSGKPANVYTNPFESKHIDRLLRTLYRLDKSRIIHCDLSRPNILLNNNYDVNIIDYQWAEQFNIVALDYDLRNSCFPWFELPNNSTMFESSALAGYLRDMTSNDADGFLRQYLHNKAIYTEKKYNKIKKYFAEHPYMSDRYSDFEQAKTNAYKMLDDSILTAELLKINMLNLHRRQYSCYDLNTTKPRNVLNAIPLMLKAKLCANQLSRIKPKFSSDANYFNYMNKYGNLWQTNMESWYPSALNWLFQVISGVLIPEGKIIFPEELNKFPNNDTVEITSSETYTLFDYNENILLKNAGNKLKELFKKAYNNISEYYSNYNTVSSIANKIFKAKV